MKTTREGGVGRHLAGGQDLTRPYRLPDDPKYALLLKPVQSAPHPLIVPGYKVYV